MYDTVIPLLRCTTCHQELHVFSIQETGVSGDIVEGIVTCPAGHTWPIERGVLVFTREDAPSDAWSRIYAEYERYRRNQETRLPEAAGEVAPLLECLSVGSTDWVLDMCTGSGGLLFNLLDRLDQETMDRIRFRDYDIRVTREVVGDPGRDVESGLFPYPNERVIELLISAAK